MTQLHQELEKMQSLIRETATQQGESSRTTSKRRRVEDFSDEEDPLECRNCGRLRHEREHVAKDMKKFFADNCAMGREIDLLNRDIDVLQAEVAAAREGRLPRTGPSGTDRVPANPQEPA